MAVSGSSPKAKAGVPPSASSSPEENEQRAERTLSLLLAEDNPGDVHLVREALQQERLNYQLTVQPDGERMLQYLDRVETGELPCPDLVLVDLNLPKRNGEAVLARLQQSAWCADVPVIVVTSSDSPKDRATATRLGASYYFRKPNDYDEFMRLGALVRSLIR